MNYEICVRLAGYLFRIRTVYEWPEIFFKDYTAKGDNAVVSKSNAPNETDESQQAVLIETTEADIAYEREKSVEEAESEGIFVREYAPAYLETLAVYRKIAEYLPKHGTVLFHGSVIAVDGEAYLFTAKSGTGKSTHTRLWREMLGERAFMVNDDKPLLRISEEGIFACGTPWDGKHHLSRNIEMPLKAICILTRDETNHIEPISSGEAYPMLLQQVYRPADAEALIATMDLIDILMAKTALYRLGCNMDPEAARVAYEGMRQE